MSAPPEGCPAGGVAAGDGLVGAGLLAGAGSLRAALRLADASHAPHAVDGMAIAVAITIAPARAKTRVRSFTSGRIASPPRDR